MQISSIILFDIDRRLVSYTQNEDRTETKKSRITQYDGKECGKKHLHTSVSHPCIYIYMICISWKIPSSFAEDKYVEKFGCLAQKTILLYCTATY